MKDLVAVLTAQDHGKAVESLPDGMEGLWTDDEEVLERVSLQSHYDRESFNKWWNALWHEIQTIGIRPQVRHVVW